ncbi:adenylate cyclase [Salinihabitans flavidus]|uniref:Adenylate cyclase n=1 Tax=Salinihabitans flavidus TaxID=569882 RepID=A0A1H8LE79_9RHOB|nr:adenylate/guanylate cyclase domain-containing protein [Salinihabitans flavidus]SEO03455.1 adenylate cyclase [Salinihabitans flavidus]
MRFRFPLRLKFFLFAALIAIAPLALVGDNLARIARDELKSAANESLTAVAAELRTSFDNMYQGAWLTPLTVIRSGIDNPDLGVPQKVSLLTLGLEELPSVVALQLTVEGSDLPVLVTDEAYSATLEEAGLDPVETLATSGALVGNIESSQQYGRPLISRISETGDWIATVALPLENGLAGRKVTLAAKIELSELTGLLRRHPFNQRGEISIVDHAGRTVLGDEVAILTQRDIVRSALPLIVAGARADALEPYVREGGTAMLGAYAFPDWFPWAVVTELPEESAYGVVNQMMERVLLVGAVGFLVATAAALFFARSLTGPILRIGRVADRIGEGDFTARVEKVRSRDEIGELSRRINTMAAQLGERLELMKFVSHGTMSAIQKADQAGMHRGGERRRVAVIFTDIRGYTEFSESVEPEVVVEMLNHYLDSQAAIVKAHGGDIDKFIGDALVAVFDGEGMEARAVECALGIEAALADLLAEHPQYNLDVGIGIASGEVVMGAMGARDRMDFTVLGSTVNLAARLCSKAAPGEVLTDSATHDSADGAARFEPLEPIALKGYSNPVPAFRALPKIG